jgi:hypothetical protein
MPVPQVASAQSGTATTVVSADTKDVVRFGIEAAKCAGVALACQAPSV